MAYVKQFTNPYPDGWVDLPSEETPIDAEALQSHTDALDAIDDELVELTTDSADWLKSRNIFDGWLTDKAYSESGELVSSDKRIASNRINTPKNSYVLSFQNDTSVTIKMAFIGWKNGAMVTRQSSWIASISSGAERVKQFDTTEYDEVAFFAYTSGNTDIPVISKTQIEEGNAKTTYQAYSKSNAELTEIVDDAKADGYIGQSIIDVQYASTTKNGIVCTNNGDGTYSFVGTASANAYFDLMTNISLDASVEYNLKGGAKNGSNNTYMMYLYSAVGGEFRDLGDGITFKPNATTTFTLYVRIASGQTVNIKVNPKLFDIPSNTELGTRVDALIPNKVTILGAVDSKGDILLKTYNSNLTKDKLILSVRPNRAYGSDAYNGYYVCSIGSSSNSDWYVKCSDDDMNNLASTTVALDVWYI